MSAGSQSTLDENVRCARRRQRSRRDFLKTGLAAATGALLAGGAETALAEAARHTTIQLSEKGSPCRPRKASGPLGGRILQRSNCGDLALLSLQEASQLVRIKQVSPVELTNACLARIQSLEPALNAFITLTSDQALDQAREAETEIQQGGWRGPLHGIPIGLKDSFDTASVRTTAGSRVFLERIPDEDAESVRRLRDAGAIFLGKHNMEEFSGGLGILWAGYFGAVHNPWDLSRYAGVGSSTGSAAALAAAFCCGALGEDTGGSIRGPASWCGLVGLKPTYGRVSKRGAIPYSWSLDHVGPITRTVVDPALMLQIIAGYDPGDTTTVDVAVPDYVASVAEDTRSLRVGVPVLGYFDNLDPEVDAAVGQALSVLSQLTASIQEIDLQQLDLGFPISEFYSVVAPSESYTFHEPYVRETPELYSQEALDNLRRYAAIPASEYIRDRRDLDIARRVIAGVFAEVNLLVTPTVPKPPHVMGEMPASGLFRNMNRFDIYGLPAISLPCGFTTTGLPIGLQIVGPHWAEETVLRLAYAYEQATDWHNQHPNL